MNRILTLFILCCIVIKGLNAQNSHQVNKYQSVTTDYESDWRFRFGGYGEMYASWKDYGLNRWNGSIVGNSKKNHAEVAIPRFVLALDYKLSTKWILGAEIEFESGGVGTAYELETGTGSENGEYEQEFEKGGEVALEQFHITRLITREFNIRAGHLVLPVGLTNAHHEPVNFFGTTRPEGETTMFPSTWHETGISLFGTIGKGYSTFSYQAMVVAGLNPNGFSKYDWVKGGRQNLFELDNFTSPAWVARLDYVGVPGLRIGGSFYFINDAGGNADKLSTYTSLGKIPVRIWNIDGEYNNPFFIVKGNIQSGHVGHAAGITRINNSYSKLSPYGRKAPFASGALTYSADLGVRVKSFFKNDKFPEVIPFAHYEYYNPQQVMDEGQTADVRCQVSMWRVGLNWKPLANLVVKADFTTRQIGTQKVFGSTGYNSENEFNIGIAYAGWFFKH